MKKDSVNLSPATESSKAVKKVKDSKPKEKKANRFAKFFKDLKSEFKKVVWPTKKQVTNNTFVVLVVVVICSLVISGIDIGFKAVFDLVLKRG